MIIVELKAFLLSEQEQTKEEVNLLVAQMAEKVKRIEALLGQNLPRDDSGDASLSAGNVWSYGMVMDRIQWIEAKILEAGTGI